MTRSLGWWMVVLTVSTHACADPDAMPPPAPETEAAFDSTQDALEPGALRSVQSEPVGGWNGPGGRAFAVSLRTAARESGHARPFGSIALSIGLRNQSAGLTQFPCTSCHAGRRVILADERVKDAHRNLQPKHPAQTGALCSTCHSADDVARLVVKGATPATLDQSYRLCAQCHFAQADSWAGGAHGKRLDGWQGRRVVMACTDCHDPHAPGLTPRIPFRGPELERPKGRAP
jgi:hypothetical protein